MTWVPVEYRRLKLFRLLVRDVQTIVVDYLYVRYIVSVVRNEFKELTRLGYKLFRAPVWVMRKFSLGVGQREFSDLATDCIVHDVVTTLKYALMCTYALDVIRLSCGVVQPTGYPDASILIFMKVFMYCAKRPPSLVV